MAQELGHVAERLGQMAEELGQMAEELGQVAGKSGYHDLKKKESILKSASMKF